MANPLHVSLMRKGVAAWNHWRVQEPDIQPDLSGADLHGVRLCGGDRNASHYVELVDGGQSFSEAMRDGADLRNVVFRGANLVDADLSRCDLSGADLSETIASRALLCSCKLSGANLYWACLEEADANNAEFEHCNLDKVNFGVAGLEAARFVHCSVNDASLFRCDLTDTRFEDTSVVGCDLTHARLVRTKFVRGTLSKCSIYGVSVWDLLAEDVAVSELSITPDGEPSITVDDLDVAQFLYLVLENQKLRRVIDNVTGKMVLILGRFTTERKRVLDMLRGILKERGFISVLFDFDKPTARNLTETVSLLAHMACFVLADISDPRSIPQELQRIVPALPSLPVQPLIAAGQAPYSMFADFGTYPSVLPPFIYRSDDELVDGLGAIVSGVQERLVQIRERRRAFEEALKSVDSVKRSGPQ